MDKRKKYGIRITSLAMSLITTISFAGCSVKKDDNKYNGSTIITNSYNDEIESPNYDDKILYEDEQTVYENKDNKADKNNNIIENTTSSKTSYNTLEDLLNLLDNNSSQFSPEINKYLKVLVENAYNNYDSLESVLCQNSFPDKCTFIKEKIISPLKNIKSIDIYSTDDENYYNLKNKYGTSKWLNDEKRIVIFCDSYNKDKYPQILMEEIIHSSQSKLNTESLGYSEYCIFAEGEANSYSWPLTFGKINNSGVEMFYDSDNLSNINYGYGTGYFTHSLASKYFMYLLTLTDYKTVNEFKNNLDSSIITDKLSSLYNIDGEEFYEKMKEVIADSSSNIYNKRTNEMVYCEKLYNYCINKKINKINNKKEALNMLDLYRYINIQYGYEYICYDESADSYVDKTDEKINNIKVISNLYDKCKEYDGINLDKEAFYALVNPKRNCDENIYFISCNNSNIKVDNNKLIVSNNDIGTYKTDINSLSSNIVNEKYNYLNCFDDLSNLNSMHK